MEKAYDIKDLQQRLKKRGVDLAEEAVKMMIEESFDWLEESAIISPTPYDNMLAVAYPEGKRMALGQADKIDGKID